MSDANKQKPDLIGCLAVHESRVDSLFAAITDLQKLVAQQQNASLSDALAAVEFQFDRVSRSFSKLKEAAK